MSTEKPTIGLFEDDPLIAKSINIKIVPLGKIMEAQCVTSGLSLIQKNQLDLAIVDIHLNSDRESGKEIIKLCQQQNIPIIAISADRNPELIDELYLLGVNHFLVKKNYLDLLFQYVSNLLKENDVNYFKNLFSEKILTNNTEFKTNLRKLWSMPLKGESIHITGPSGSGKSLLATIYHQEIFPNTPFVHLNCAEIPESLLESELFGHTKGAFTNAQSNYEGKISLSNGGILFLDEIGSLNLNLQAKLLKVLESKSFFPVGSNKPVNVKFTLITATWEDLYQKAKNKEFRLDLLQRISHFTISIPSLASRKEDIHQFIINWMDNYPRRFNIEDAAFESLLQYDYPGNYRELKSVLSQLAQCPTGLVSSDLVQKILKFQLNHHEDLSNSSYPYEEIMQLGLKEYLRRLEKQIVSDSYEKHQHFVSAVLEDLKLSPSSFYRIIQSQ